MVSIKHRILLKWKLDLLFLFLIRFRMVPIFSLSLSPLLHSAKCTNKHTLSCVYVCVCDHTYLWWWNISIKSNFKMEMLLCPLFVCLFHFVLGVCVGLCGCFFALRNVIWRYSFFSGSFITPWFSPLPWYASDGLRIIMNHFWAVKNMVLFHE